MHSHAPTMLTAYARSQSRMLLRINPIEYVCCSGRMQRSSANGNFEYIGKFDVSIEMSNATKEANVKFCLHVQERLRRLLT